MNIKKKNEFSGGSFSGKIDDGRKEEEEEEEEEEEVNWMNWITDHNDCY